MARAPAQPQQGGYTGQPNYGHPPQQSQQQQQGQLQDAPQQQGQEAGGAVRQAGQPIFRDWASI